VINSFLAQRKAGKPMTITADGMQTRDFTHIRDVVRANILAAEHTSIYKGESFNIGAGKNQSINRIAELIGGDIEYIPARLEPHDTLADNSKAKEILGWVPEVTIEEGIEELKKLYL
jgi:UDP-glucose 4-epimerase